ncbi:MAG: XisI protein [Planctomycetes bacterium]|nr:XisI protein [Planctomycetota bacterium]
MDTLDRYREIVRRILTKFASIPYSHGNMNSHVVFDRDSDRYLVVTDGWDGVRRVHGVVLHIDIIDGKVWVQRDSTNIEIVRELEEAGVPKHDIVLGFRHPDVRPLTEYAVA